MGFHQFLELIRFKVSYFPTKHPLVLTFFCGFLELIKHFLYLV